MANWRATGSSVGRCWIGLGGNLGDVQETFRAARRQLHAYPGLQVLRTSRIYRSQPMGRDAGQPFLNAALELDAEIAAFNLLDALQRVEHLCGRVRSRLWGPRTLDLDWLVAASGMVLSTPRLTVPHAHLTYRRFALEPLAELAPDVLHPPTGLTIRQLTDRLQTSPLQLAIAAADTSQAESLVQQLRDQSGHARVSVWTGQQPRPTLLVWYGSPKDLRPELPEPVIAAPWGRDPVQFAVDVLTAASDAPQPLDPADASF